jgi:8-oxo-dGTP diphosphatase
MMQEKGQLHLETRVVIFSLGPHGLEVLLTPFESSQPNLWQIPGSAAEPQLGLEISANHCLNRFTGLNEAYLEQLYTYGDPQRSCDQHLISIVYFALIPMGSYAPPAGAPPSGWFAYEKLPALAMDHLSILNYALRRLRYKLEYTAVGFELLPEAFSLSQLQKVYELILGETLDKRNFRRRILEAGVIEPTPMRRTGEGRPAQLYRYRPDAVAEVKVRRLFP